MKKINLAVEVALEVKDNGEDVELKLLFNFQPKAHLKVIKQNLISGSAFK